MISISRDIARLQKIAAESLASCPKILKGATAVLFQHGETTIYESDAKLHAMTCIDNMEQGMYYSGLASSDADKNR